MLGAIAGDVVGAPFEYAACKRRDFPLYSPAAFFTDDSVCTIAIADALLTGSDLATTLRTTCSKYPDAGYGGMFGRWVAGSINGPYGSWGNGAPMRVIPVGWLAASDSECLEMAARTAVITHDHPEAVRGAQAVALAILRARKGDSAASIRGEISQRFGYDLSLTPDQIRPDYVFTESSLETVPPAIVCALGADSWENAVRDAVSLGGDADTLACIAGGIAHALFGLPDELWQPAAATLPDDLKAVVDRFLLAVPSARATRAARAT